MTLSKESQAFLDNMRLYLFSSSKKEDEVAELMEELEDHLIEAEQHGKSVEHIIGKSPKAYMKEIEVEVETDKKFWFLVVPLIMLNGFAYLIMNKALEGDRGYSLLVLIGNPIVFIVTIFLLFGLFRFFAANKVSKKVTLTLYFLMGIAPTAMFTGIFVGDLFIETPMLTISPFLNALVIIAACIVFIASAVYWKTWISVIVPAVLYLPQIVLRSVDIKEESEFFILMSVYIILSLSLAVWYFRQNKKED
ncbi:hypothetical protein SFC66_05080 [Terribacillus saccharophilus]|uniref:HAAS domain-containing protein n=1 Tax=Terribacillus saccharophilus TaxID=361277 RepID=UPI003981B3E5